MRSTASASSPSTQPDAASARDQRRRVGHGLRGRYPRLTWKRDVAEEAAEAGGCCLLTAIFSALAFVGLAGLPILLMRRWN